MELDDLKQALVALDTRLEQQVATAQRVERQHSAASRVRRSLRPLAVGQLAQAGAGFLSILLGILAWRSDLADPAGLFVSGVIVHIYGVAMITLAFLTRTAVRRVNPSGPVVAMQQRLAELRRLNVLAGYVLGMSWWVLWVPFTIVLFRALFGVNLYALGPQPIVLMVCGGVIGFLCSAALHRWAAATGRARLANLFDNALTGSSLRTAEEQLSAIRRFARD